MEERGRAGGCGADVTRVRCSLLGCPALFRLSGSVRNYLSQFPRILLSRSRYLSHRLWSWLSGGRQCVTLVPFISPHLSRPPLFPNTEKPKHRGKTWRDP